MVVDAPLIKPLLQKAIHNNSTRGKFYGSLLTMRESFNNHQLPQAKIETSGVAQPLYKTGVGVFSVGAANIVGG